MAQLIAVNWHCPPACIDITVVVYVLELRIYSIKDTSRLKLLSVVLEAITKYPSTTVSIDIQDINRTFPVSCPSQGNALTFV